MRWRPTVCCFVLSARIFRPIDTACERAFLFLHNHPTSPRFRDYWELQSENICKQFLWRLLWYISLTVKGRRWQERISSGPPLVLVHFFNLLSLLCRWNDAFWSQGCGLTLLSPSWLDIPSSNIVFFFVLLFFSFLVQLIHLQTNSFCGSEDKSRRDKRGVSLYLLVSQRQPSQSILAAEAVQGSEACICFRTLESSFKMEARTWIGFTAPVGWCCILKHHLQGSDSAQILSVLAIPLMPAPCTQQ